MGLTDLFKSRAAKLKPDPRIRWFGKLPTYPDYYRSKGDQPWTAEFNDWVLRGFELYQKRRSGAGSLEGRLPISGCMLRLPESGMTVFTSILDFGGDMRGRPFPMCFYIGFPTALWRGPTSDRLSAPTRVVRDLLALRRDVARFVNSPGRIESAFGEREVDLSGLDDSGADGSWATAARSAAFSDWFTAAKRGLKIQDEDRWLRAAARWGDALVRHEAKNFEPTLRLPLATGISLDVQVAGWIRWLESRMDLKRRFLSLIVSGDIESETGSLSVIARTPVSDDFMLLTPLANKLPYLDDLSAVEETDGGGGPADDAPGSAIGGDSRAADFNLRERSRGPKPAAQTDGGGGSGASLGSRRFGSWYDFAESPTTVT